MYLSYLSQANKQTREELFYLMKAGITFLSPGLLMKELGRGGGEI